MAASVMKLTCGVGNNAAWLVVLEALDHARLCKRYKDYHVRHEFKQAVKMFHDYERGLIYARDCRMFHVADMDENTRKKYGDITDRQYYEFWTGTGAAAYQSTRPLLTSLWNKYRLSLLGHDVVDSEHVAWVMVGQAALELSVKMYETALDAVVRDWQLPKEVAVRIFRQFSLASIAMKWRKALCALSPDSECYDLTPMETKNIQHGVEQLQEAWSDPKLLFRSTSQSADDYDEVFRDKKEIKAVKRELKNLEIETIKNLKENDG